MPDSLYIILDSIRLKVASDANYDSLITAINTQKGFQDNGVPGYYYGITLFCCVLFIPILYYFLGPNRSWSKGVFPRQLRYNSKNLFEAYLCLGLIMMRKDAGDLKDKMLFFAGYLQQTFNTAKSKNFSKIADNIPVKISEESILDWLKRNMPQTERIQVIDLLVNLTFMNDRSSDAELNMIYRVAQELNIDLSDVDAIVSIRYKQQQERKKTRKPTCYKSFHQTTFL